MYKHHLLSLRISFLFYNIFTFDRFIVSSKNQQAFLNGRIASLNYRVINEFSKSDKFFSHLQFPQSQTIIPIILQTITFEFEAREESNFKACSDSRIPFLPNDWESHFEENKVHIFIHSFCNKSTLSLVISNSRLQICSSHSYPINILVR